VLPEALGQRPHELAERGADLRRGRRRRAGDEEEGTGLGGRQPAEVGAAAAEEPPAAVASLLGVHGEASNAERLEVPPGRPLRHLQLGGDLGRGDLAPLLQEQQHRHQPVGSHGPMIPDEPANS
jgi:hypothetical protein